MKKLIAAKNDEELYSQYIDNWDNISEKDQQRCMKMNELRVVTYCLPPLPLPDWETNE